MPCIETVILAGGRMDESLREFSDAPCKAFIPLGGRPMVEYVVDAVRAEGRPGRISLAARDDLVCDSLRKKVDFVAPPGESMIDSLRNAARCLEPVPDFILALPSDIPLVTPEAIGDFIDRSLDPPTDVAYGYLAREDSEARFPDAHHTYVKTADGTFCGTGFFLMRPGLMDAFEGLFRRLSANRKNPLALAGVLGPGIILSFLLKTLRVRDLEEKVMQLMGGCAARAVKTAYAEAAFNVDAPNELRIAREEMETGSHT
jgi:GTP:adenosylcobinamide-phosphate guanylyltransferase